MSTGLILLIITGVCVVVGVLAYNSLIGKRNAVENAFGSVDVQLKQRHDLIPNLVASVKQYMTHERGTLEDLTRLRTEAMAGGLSTDQRVALESKISKTLSGIMVAVENYPDLKAESSFTMLQRSLNEVEAQISAARRTYNAAVTEFNNAVEMFPTNVLAGFMGFVRKAVFEAAEGERLTPDVKSLFQQ